MNGLPYEMYANVTLNGRVSGFPSTKSNYAACFFINYFPCNSFQKVISENFIFRKFCVILKGHNNLPGILNISELFYLKKEVIDILMLRNIFWSIFFAIFFDQVHKHFLKNKHSLFSLT